MRVPLIQSSHTPAPLAHPSNTGCSIPYVLCILLTTHAQINPAQSGVASFVNDVKAQLGVTVAKRLEASDPNELDLAWLRSELTPAGTPAAVDDGEKKPFAKPRGPARRK